MATALGLVQFAADELSLARPTNISDTSADNTAQKLVRHLTRTCRQLSAEYDWSRLRREKLVTTTATEEQVGALPADFLRFVPETIWNRSTRTRVNGPLPPDDWQSRKATLVTGAYINFILRNNAFLVTPIPGAGQTIAFDYVTKYIGINAAATTELLEFTADTDVAYFDDELVILGIVWRYRKAEGLDYSEEFREYGMRRANLIKMDGGRRVVDMNALKQDRPVNTTYSEIADIFTI